jgi:hypothetical protein
MAPLCVKTRPRILAVRHLMLEPHLSACGSLEDRGRRSSGQFTARPAPSGGLRRRCRGRPGAGPSGSRCRGCSDRAAWPDTWAAAGSCRVRDCARSRHGSARRPPGRPGATCDVCFAQLHPVDGPTRQVGLKPGVVGDPAKKLPARDRDWGPVGRRWWPVIAHGSPGVGNSGYRASVLWQRRCMEKGSSPGAMVRQRRAAPAHPCPALRGIQWCFRGRRWSVVRSWSSVVR